MKFVTTFLAIFISTFILANDGRIQGHIKDAKDEFDLRDVIVQLQNENLSTLSTSSGFFDITEIRYGKYYVIFTKKGYYSLVIPDVEVNSPKPVKLEIDMVEGDEKEYLFLEIGGIQVTANRELLAEEPETVHKITSGEIEHMQANSLSNVLSLIPGNVQNEIPGLSTKQNISLRTFDNSADDVGALFGTKVIVDDIPLSNNADLQIGVGVGYGTSVQTTSKTQFDLREVVADNLEKVEVIAGASSVEYGDHSQGLVIAKTKTQNVPTRLKIKNNSDTREANLMGSFFASNTNFIYNLNYGYSERNIRVTGDEYHRIAGELKTKNDFLNRNLSLLQIFRYGRKIEEDDDESDPYGTKAYNRDYNLTYSNQFDYNWNEVTNLYIRNFINFRRKNSWKRKLETPDLAIWTDRMTPGTREGIIPESATYFSDVRTIGQEWTYGSKIRFKRKILSGSTLHRLLIGLEFQTDDNNGPGKSYDLLKPPYGKTSDRPRSYNDVPGTVQFSIFAEDRISGELMFPYTFYAGFRLDSYNPKSFVFSNLFDDKDVFASDQGTFFNPRLGLKVKILPKTQLRFSYGKSSKTPPISSVYPGPFFLDLYDLTYRIVTDTSGNQIVENVDLVSTYKYDRTVLNLKGYQNTKYEISLDHKIGEIGLSVSSYYQLTTGIPKSIRIPYIYYRYFWLDWPEATNKIKMDSVTTHDGGYSVARNLGKSETSGIEFNLSTHRIESLNMRFRMNASFNFKKYSSKNYKIFGDTYYFSAGDTLPSGDIAFSETQILPYYYPQSSWRQRAVFNFYLDYISKPLGIWLTFKAQHLRWQESISIYQQNPEAKGYFQDGVFYSIDAETSEDMGFNRTYQKYSITVDDSKPDDQWMFGVVVSKSLFKGAEVSIAVENILNDRAYYKNRDGFYSSRNHEIFWSIGFSSKVDEIFN